MATTENKKPNWMSMASIALIILGALLILGPGLSKDDEGQDTQQTQPIQDTTVVKNDGLTENLPESGEGLDQNERYDVNEVVNTEVREVYSSAPSVVGVWEVSEPDGYINGHGYVDLGLPSGVKWAWSNVGAKMSIDDGDYFAWGETKPKKLYSEDNCETSKKNRKWLKENGYLSAEDNLTPSHDAATQNWGEPWRMPTFEEIYELRAHTRSQWLSLGNTKGRMLMSRINGKTIFLPAQGDMMLDSLYSQNKHGYYWSSTADKSNTEMTYYLYFTNTGIETFSINRGDGFPIRPVSE